MILISHRGNINGKNTERENQPEYIDETLELGYDVEVDVWYEDGKLYLGHDLPQYEIQLEWLWKRHSKLWIHCKNLKAIEFFNNQISNSLHYFWHEEDEVTLTSKGYIWAYPGNQPIKGSIAVLPELNHDDLSDCYGICSDFIKKYKDG